MTTDNKDCSGCKFCEPSVDAFICISGIVCDLFTDDARALSGDCGPSARYYEPKEQQP